MVRCLPNDLGLAQRALRCIAIAVLATYVGWQAYWLWSGQIPPSLFLALTGWPSPTTGGTRSLQALLAGELGLCVYYNPMTLPIVSVLLATLGWLLLNIRKLRSQSLPRPIVLSGIAILLCAWSVKLVQAVLESLSR